jgi:hypothetical protein
MIVDRILFLTVFTLLFQLLMMKANVLFYIKLILSIFVNPILFIFFVISFIYLFNKNFKSIVVDYLRPYYFFFKQLLIAIPFIVFICFLL